MVENTGEERREKGEERRGGEAPFKSHYNVTLTGEDADGVSYFGTSTGNGKGEFPESETEDVVISRLIVSIGGTPNFVVKTVLHHSADGTVRVDKATEECQG